MNPNTCLDKIARDGWVVVHEVVPADLVGRMVSDLESALEVCRKIQIKNEVDGDAGGTVHHLPELGESFVEYLSELPLYGVLETYFDGPFVLNALGGFVNRKTTAPYATRVHRDLRTFSQPLRLMLNTLVMLDDFTPDNGATYLCSGSHLEDRKPSDAECFRGERAIGKKGSVLLFDSNLWHAAGHNQTDAPRRAITPMFTKPFFKPQYDYPRALGYDRGPSLPPRLRQVLGYNSRIPATLDEWYRPPVERMYRREQG